MSIRSRKHRQAQHPSLFGPVDEVVSLQLVETNAFFENPIRQPMEVVLSGSYRKDLGGLHDTFEHLRDLGCHILSPDAVDVVAEKDGFAYMRGETVSSPQDLEIKHLRAIQRAQFMWLHAPDGYVGTSASLEVGFAHAIGVPVYSSQVPQDLILQKFVQTVPDPSSVVAAAQAHVLPRPKPAVEAFQQYYQRVASQRGYESEGAKECLLLMLEEVGELARSLRKNEGLVRHGKYGNTSVSEELSDVFIYIVHLANVLKIDLSSAVARKEDLNWQKFLGQY